MVSQMLEFLVDTVAGFFVVLLLARFHFQQLRVPFRNPLVQFVVALTNWLVLPARRLVPSAGGLDMATLVLAWLVQMAALGLLYALRGYGFFAAPGVALGILCGLALVDLLRFSLYMLMVALIIQAVLSWVSPSSPLAPLFDAIARPFLRPIRRFVPPVANVDLSPLVLLVLLQVLLIPLAYGRALVASLL